jgi:3-dehydroquinate synthase
LTAVTVRVATEHPYDVRIGPGVLSQLAPTRASFARSVVLSDSNVAPLLAARCVQDEGDLVVVPAGEGSKSFATLERVLDAMTERGLDRTSAVVALGGGVIGDLAGLAASLYHRGIAFVQCPTTLLAQVDASVGGKTAVNLAGGKNLAGTFWQPSLVLADTDALVTLPQDEYRSGLGDVVKTALVEGPDALAHLEGAADALARREPEALMHVVQACVSTKAGIVARDEREGGERKLLNLGHTFAHGIEHAAGYGTIPHGICVAVGLVLAARAGRELGLLDEAELPERLEQLLGRLGLPRDLDALRTSSRRALGADELTAGMQHDKKGAAGAPRFVVPRRAGRIELDVPIGREVLAALFAGR